MASGGTASSAPARYRDEGGDTGRGRPGDSGFDHPRVSGIILEDDDSAAWRAGLALPDCGLLPPQIPMRQCEEAFYRLLLIVKPSFSG